MARWNPCTFLMRYGYMKLDRAAEITMWVFLMVDIVGLLHTIPLIISFANSHYIFDSFVDIDNELLHNTGLTNIVHIYKNCLLIKIAKLFAHIFNIIATILALRYAVFKSSQKYLQVYMFQRFVFLMLIFSLVCYSYALTGWIESNHLIYETRSMSESTCAAIIVDLIILIGQGYGFWVLIAYISEHKFPLVIEHEQPI